MSKPQEVIVELEKGNYLAVQQNGYVIEKDGQYLNDAFSNTFASIEYALFEDKSKKADSLAKHSGGKVKKAKRLIIDFYEVEQ